ncbi:MAG: hypothetical protein PHC34_09270 [Candidatus Gastranaerophilales bacterium]|nr:hypothetical protein [Candidatus Gastranaerophilales bacterium]
MLISPIQINHILPPPSVQTAKTGLTELVTSPFQTQYIPPVIVQPKDKQINTVSSKNTVSQTNTNNYVHSFIVKNSLKVNLSGTDNTKIGQDGINLNEAFITYDSQLKTSLNRLLKDKNVDNQWLKWIDLPDKQMQKAQKIQNFVEQNVRNKFEDVVVLGIGGSSLGPKAVLGALGDTQWNLMNKEQRNGYPRIHFIENIDPERFSEVMDKLNLKDTLFLTISKSGKTPETSATFLNAQERLQDAVAKGVISKEDYKKHIVAVTDKNPEKSVLKQEAIKYGYQTFEVPDDVGGRYSVFSDVGLVPAAMVGINITEFLRGASNMSKVCSDTKNLKENPAANQALVQYMMYQKGKEYSVLMPYSDKLALVSDWYAQLWAESLGKTNNKDGNPIHANYSPIKAIGAIDQHSQLQLWREGKNDKVFTFITVKNFNKNVPITNNPTNVPDALSYMKYNSINDLIKEEARATTQVLQKDKRPVINVEIPRINAYNLGQLMQMFMFQTAIVGEMQGLGLNTFLQPAVEEGKKITKEGMGELSKQKESQQTQTK